MAKLNSKVGKQYPKPFYKRPLQIGFKKQCNFKKTGNLCNPVGGAFGCVEQCANCNKNTTV
ncbi:hypothetical protein [Mesonia aquimarina]|uniref:hypothetical protein n=1 Tax=Mesonia aquimarina TaxID=1504967 RepID=UPI000EF5FBE7|nr:hypothetical protein [Mesonia aquimarina]